LFLQKRLFFEKHRFFFNIFRKTRPFFSNQPVFSRHFPEKYLIFSPKSQKSQFLVSPQNRSNKEHISTISPPTESTVQPAGESKRNAPHYKKKLYSVILLTISCFNH